MSDNDSNEIQQLVWRLRALGARAVVQCHGCHKDLELPGDLQHRDPAGWHTCRACAELPGCGRASA